MSWAAISRTALRARALDFCQSEPPILCRVGLLAADVAGELVELVGGDEQPVAGLAALARRVLDDQVFPGGAVDGALHQLDVPADAVLLVHHVVAGLQLQRVDGVAPPARHLAHVPGRGAPPAGDVVAGEQHEPGRLVDEAAGQRAAGDQHLAGGGRGRDLLGQPGAEAGVAEHLDRPLGGAVPLEDQRDRPALAGPALEVVDHPGGLAVVERGRLGGQGHRDRRRRG